MFTKNLKFFGQILHPQWPAQTSNMGHKMDFILVLLQACNSLTKYRQTVTKFIIGFWCL
jgi:hypothetical protein